ncbi:MAG: NAD-dependent epimerase/dehydratase family protein [Gemmatimonadaceae bacterium]|nr:NAD-dependent epimerase/dehydratase family protein [Gemmatimonadaceae bacterium]
MKILVLGGTGYIGPHLVTHALERGHQVTLFNRGRTRPGLFPKAEQLIGDRNTPTGHDALKGRTWDVVYDLPATNPQWVVNSTNVLKGNVKQYVYVSSTAAYKDFTRSYPDETHPAQDPAPIDGPDAANAPYGNKKVRCEQLVQAAFGSGATIVRPGLIVGPGDLTDRFTYWPVRIEKGGDILAPGKLDDPAQWIDARDLTEWMVRLGENSTGGVFNAVGPRTVCGIGELLYGIKACYANDARFTWVPQEFLTANKIRSWAEMPVWSFTGASTVAFSTSVIEKAKAAGLTFRPLSVTVRDAMTWYHARPAAEQERLRAGISAEREKEILALWRAQNGGAR